MSNIKTREDVKRTIKAIDKSAVVTQKTKDNIVNIKEKSENVTNTEDRNINEYAENQITNVENTVVVGSNKIKQTSNESLKTTTENIRKSKVKIKEFKEKQFAKKTSKGINKSSKVTIKTGSEVSKKAKKVTQESMKASQRAIKMAREAARKTAQGIKTTIKATISSIKAIITGTKALVAALIAGGSLAMIVIVIICLVGLLLSSIFGIFFSSENTGKNNIKMSDCIVELNSEMDYRIKQIENMNPHDEIIITSNKAEWKDMLSIYAVRVSNGINEQEVMSIDEDKKKILKEVFWDMNSISYEIKTEKYDSGSIGSLNIQNFQLNSNYQRPTVQQNNEEEKKVLHVYINSTSIDEIKNKYAFNEDQIKQYQEISGEEYLTLWSSVIYGVYGSSGEITEWKQKGKEWSNIKIGSTNSTIGDIGCLVTSIAILIKKSDVPTKNIYPFNPGTFVTALNNNYGFDSRGNLQYAAISKVVPNFQYQGRIDLREKSKSDKLYEVRKYYESGYYIALEVKGATENSQHWVAVDGVTNNTILMLDPGSSATDVWDKYDWNKTSQFVYFKAN